LEALRVIEERDRVVRAWAHVDGDLALRDADRLDAEAISTGHPEASDTPLRGLVLGVKDVFDTGDMPTEHGSVLYRGNRPRSDASAVALLRRAGAVCLGKTVTTELAMFHPGPTTNPHRAGHTPGGSSMGSAAAVASNMADIALGTQTAGSVTRPASFCGVYGFKPTFGSVSVAGLKLVAPSLDTAGWFARSPEVLDLVRVCLTGRSPAPHLDVPPRLLVVRTEQWDECGPDGRLAVEALARMASGAGADVVDADMPAPLVGMSDRHKDIMCFEASRSLAWERQRESEISNQLRDLIDYGSDLDPATYDVAIAMKRSATSSICALFDGFDAAITPAVVGEAPAGLDYTGDPRFARLWTLLGLPSVTVPVTLGSSGLPVGAQLIGPAGSDARLLEIAAWLGTVLGNLADV
jgi:Asp-tRNA(Asn)/Glu-tRNA(Gln) amidotransferase A subunit family amidase